MINVIAFNGSPKSNGNSAFAIDIVATELKNQGINVEVIHVGNKVIRGCTACNSCAKNQDEKCILQGDDVNQWIQKTKFADGIILGSPVHYASLGATMKCFLDRLFYVASVNKSMLRHKVGAAVVAVRRSGGVTTFDQLNNYLNYSEMLIATSNYWNVIHGTAPGDAASDNEGMQIMRILGKNMAWLLKLRENGKGIVEEPEMEPKIFTHFVR